MATTLAVALTATFTAAGAAWFVVTPNGFVDGLLETVGTFFSATLGAVGTDVLETFFGMVLSPDFRGVDLGATLGGGLLATTNDFFDNLTAVLAGGLAAGLAGGLAAGLTGALTTDFTADVSGALLSNLLGALVGALIGALVDDVPAPLTTGFVVFRGFTATLAAAFGVGLGLVFGISFAVTLAVDLGTALSLLAVLTACWLAGLLFFAGFDFTACLL